MDGSLLRGGRAAGEALVVGDEIGVGVLADALVGLDEPTGAIVPDLGVAEDDLDAELDRLLSGEDADTRERPGTGEGDAAARGDDDGRPDSPRGDDQGHDGQGPDAPGPQG